MKTYAAIARHKKGPGFTYSDKNGDVKDKKTIEYIQSLAIPPAWEDVLIARSPKAKIQATGRDEAGRLQAIYNPVFRARQEKLKFDRILRFALALPKLRKQLDKDMARKRLVKDKVLACIVRLIDEAYFRVGNEKYSRENHSYGITTMRSKHVEVSGDTVTFDFVGKSGIQHVKEITDHQVAQIVKKLDELPGYEVFRYQDNDGQLHDIHSEDVNEYIKTHMGEEFSAKDFRTWGGTLAATSELANSERSRHKTEREKMVAQIVKSVADKLGNTPAIARSAYIDPRVISAYLDSSNIYKVKEAVSNMRPRKYMSRDEQCVLHLLQAS